MKSFFPKLDANYNISVDSFKTKIVLLSDLY